MHVVSEPGQARHINCNYEPETSDGSTRGPTGASTPVKMSLAPAVPPELTE